MPLKAFPVVHAEHVVAAAEVQALHFESQAAQVLVLKKFPSVHAVHAVSAAAVQALHFESQALQVLSEDASY